MDWGEYQDAASRTECDQGEARRRLSGNGLVPVRFNHAVIGLVGEVGELACNLEKTVYYGQGFDRENAAEELGDMLWYIALACNALEFDLERIAESNIAKLRKRFPDKYTDYHAAEENRDRKAEQREARLATVKAENIVGLKVKPESDINLEARRKSALPWRCPKCKAKINDEVLRQLFDPTVDREEGHCPDCMAIFTKDTIKCPPSKGS